MGDERRFGIAGESSRVFNVLTLRRKQREVIEPQPCGLVFAQQRKRLARDRSSFVEIALLGESADEVAERYGKKIVVNDRCLACFPSAAEVVMGRAPAGAVPWQASST